MERRLKKIFHRPKSKPEGSLSSQIEYDTAASATPHRYDRYASHEDNSSDVTADQDHNLSQHFQQLELGDVRQQHIAEQEPRERIADHNVKNSRHRPVVDQGQDFAEHLSRKPVAASRTVNSSQHNVYDSSLLKTKRQDLVTPFNGRAETLNGSQYSHTRRNRETFETEDPTGLSAAPAKTLSHVESSQTPPKQQSHDAKLNRTHRSQIQSSSASTNPGKRSLLVEDAKSPISLDGIIDLSNSEDTTVNTRWAPAVTHETINKDVHHIREEHITREIHTHDYFHRILPIIDVEVLPPRHFVPSATDPAELVEVAGNSIPGRRDDDDQNMRHWFIARAVEEHAGGQTGSDTGPRRFTARTFRDGDGDRHEWIGEDGVQRSTTTWIHPPTIEDGGQRSGQTIPFHFGSTDPSRDGFRAKDFPYGHESLQGRLSSS